MNLLTYAVSQKLQHNNEMWKFIHRNEPIPHDVVADAFAETLQQYEDLRAERLATNYQSFVSNHLPVTFAPNSNGIHVAGEIQDEALDVIHALYGKTDEDVIRDTIRSSIYAINPGRAIEIDDIQMIADDMHARAIQRHELLQAQKLRQSTQDIVTEVKEEFVPQPAPVVQHAPVDVMDEPATYVSSERQTPLGAAKQALVEAEAKLGDVLYPNKPILEEPVDVVLTPVEDAPAISKVLSESDEIPQLQDVIEEQEITDAGVLASAWNNLVQNFKDKGLEDRIALDTPLTFAIA